MNGRVRCFVALVLSMAAVGHTSAVVGEARRPSDSVLAIKHEGILCVLRERHLVLEATIEPSDKTQLARVFFRASGHDDWYFVAMERSESGFVAVLPRPLPETRQIHYYVLAVDESYETVRTPEFSPFASNTCPESGGVVPVFVESADVVVLSDSQGAASVPPGFDPDSISRSEAGGSGLLIGAAAAGAGVAGTMVLVASGGDDADVACFTTEPDSSNVLVGQTVRFDAGCSTAGSGSINSYEWDFGDGSPQSSGLVVEHIYSRAGTFDARLTIHTVDGNATTARAIRVLVADGGAGELRSFRQQGVPVVVRYGLVEAGVGIVEGSAVALVNRQREYALIGGGSQLTWICRNGRNTVMIRSRNLMPGAVIHLDFGASDGFVPGSLKTASETVVVEHTSVRLQVPSGSEAILSFSFLVRR